MTQQPSSPQLAAALDAAARGWRVFPLRPGGKPPALHGESSCPGTGECAGGHRKWEQRATTDPDRIRACWAAGAFNVGIACGPSALVVIDLDKPKGENDAPDGAANFRALCERAEQPVPTTYTVRTGGGGWHLYFTAPTGARLGNTAGRLAPLIDTRAWGGYVVAPGSATPDGPYSVSDAYPVANLPEWLQKALTVPQKPTVAPFPLPAARNASRYAAAALHNETANVAQAPEGSRNRTLVRAARALGRLVASGDLSREEVEQALNEAGQAAGLPPGECRAAVTSALNWSIAHNPRRPAA
jgi:Bifunctional DNA primase/polymerase, N-terminal